MQHHPSAADINQFQASGYWVAPVLFALDELEALKQAFVQIYDGHLVHRDWPFVPTSQRSESRAIDFLTSCI